jgi:hypothetical protein
MRIAKKLHMRCSSVESIELYARSCRTRLKLRRHGLRESRSVRRIHFRPVRTVRVGKTSLRTICLMSVRVASRRDYCLGFFHSNTVIQHKMARLPAESDVNG